MLKFIFLTISMRQLPVIIFILFFTKSFGQVVELQGKYSASFMGAETINFVGKDSFYFEGFYCISGVEGKGRCEILGNYLYLNFEKNKNTISLDSFQLDKVIKTKSADSFTKIKITCVDNNGSPIANSSIYVMSSGKNIIGSSTNENGISEFKIDKNIFPLEIKFSAFNFQTKTILFSEQANYELILGSKKSNSIKLLENGEQYIYEIDELTEDLISLRTKNGKGNFRKYYRKKEIE